MAMMNMHDDGVVLRYTC